MRNIPAQLLTHYEDDTTTVATALKITREDGLVLALTSHDKSDLIEIGSESLLYLADPGFLTTDIVIQANAAVGNFELTTVHDNTIFTAVDILNGLWRHASFVVFRYNYNDLVVDPQFMLAGNIGEITINLNDLKVEMRDIRQYLQQTVGPVSAKNCRVRLGSPSCGVRLDPPQWAAGVARTVVPTGDAKLGSIVKPTVYNGRHFKCTTAGTSGGVEPAWNTTVGGTTNDNGVIWTTVYALTVTGAVTSFSGLLPFSVFQDTSRSEPEDWFGDGLFKFTSGDNTGAYRKVKGYESNGTFILTTPYFGAIGVGDTYVVEAGCRKRLEEDCADKHNNNLNQQAEPHREGIDSVTAPPTPNISAAEDAVRGFGG